MRAFRSIFSSRTVLSWVAISFLLSLGSLLLSAQIDETAGRTLEGRVRVQGGGVPPHGFDVKLELHGMLVDRAQSDSSGRFRFYGVGANTYTVIIEDPDFQPARETVSINTLQGAPVQVIINLRPIGGEGATPSPADMAAAAMSEAVSKLPSKAKKEWEEGLKSAEKKKTEDAVGHFQAVIQLAPDFYPAHTSLGYQYLGQGKLTEAEKAFSDAVSINAEDPGAQIGLGNVYFQTQRFPQAETALRAGLAQDPGSTMGHYLLGATLARTGKSAEAEKELRGALTADPNMALAQMTLIDLLLQQQRDQDAYKELKIFVDRFPQNPMIGQAQQMLQQMEQWLKSQQQQN